jgi:hypothetical protein
VLVILSDLGYQATQVRHLGDRYRRSAVPPLGLGGLRSFRRRAACAEACPPLVAATREVRLGGKRRPAAMQVAHSEIKLLRSSEENMQPIPVSVV